MTAFLALTLAEGPYKPAGWRPSGARFSLPTEYGPPKTPEPTVETTTVPQEDADVEITKEELEQLVETTIAPEISKEYLPPSANIPQQNESENEADEDFLKVQGLPRKEAGPQFRQLPGSRSRFPIIGAQASARLQAPQFPFLLSPQFAPPLPLMTAQFRSFGKLEQQPAINEQAEIVGEPQNSYGPPEEVSLRISY